MNNEEIIRKSIKEALKNSNLDYCESGEDAVNVEIIGGYIVKNARKEALNSVEFKTLLSQAKVDGATTELSFFLKCLKEDYAFKNKVVMSKDKLNYIWSLIQVNEERLAELE